MLQDLQTILPLEKRLPDSNALPGTNFVVARAPYIGNSTPIQQHRQLLVGVYVERLKLKIEIRVNSIESKRQNVAMVRYTEAKTLARTVQLIQLDWSAQAASRAFSRRDR